MRFAAPLYLAILASLSLATPIHGHHIHKREEPNADLALEKRGVVTAYVTQVSYVTATINPASTTAETTQTEVTSATTQATEAVTSATTQTTAQAETSTTAPQVESSSETTVLTSSTQAASSIEEETATSAATSTEEETSTSAATSTSSSSTSTSTSSSWYTGAKGITYSPYTDSGSCKDSATIQSDIEKLSDFDVIRLYDTDCSGVENVLAAKGSDQLLFAGIYYLAKIEASVEIISAAVKDCDGEWDNIYTVSIGNELVNSGDNTPAEISAAMTTARSYLESAGYSGKVVSVDTLVAVQDNTELCNYSDYIAVNSHPYWDGSVYPSESGTWLKTQISNIKEVCGGEKSVLITETGWPTKGDDYGVAVPSVANQRTAIEAINSECGDQVILFTTYNDLWKDAGSYGVEKYWGILDD